MVITYPLLTVVDDSGAVVTGATVGITSVLDKSGSAIASHGATLNSSGANVSVDYDAEAKGEAWVVLAISKVGSTFTGLNAAPAFYLAKDSGRVLNAIPNAAPAVSGGLPILGSAPLTNLDATVSSRSTFAGGAVASVTGNVGGNVAGSVGSISGVSFPTNFSALAITASTGLVSLNLAQTGLTVRDLSSVADAALTVGDALVAAIGEAAGDEAVVGTAYMKKTPAGTTFRIFALDSATAPTSRS